MDDVLLRADRNMAAAWWALISHMPAPARREVDGGVALRSGLPVPLFNPTFVLSAPSDPVALVEDVRAGTTDPYILYSRDDVAPGVADAGLAAGLIEHYRPPLMVLDDIPSDAPPLPPGLVVERVTAATAETCAQVLAAGFGMPPDFASFVFNAESVATDDYVAFLGLVDGTPVSTAAYHLSDDLVGIYSVATDPAHGRHGYGAALTMAAAVAGRRALGAPAPAILQASGAGAPVYERLGFRVADRYRQLEPTA
jgi:GNAT superfamily N-acetyltransferase